MPQQIDVPGVGLVEFPDEMDDASIATAIERDILRTPPTPPSQVAPATPFTPQQSEFEIDRVLRGRPLNAPSIQAPPARQAAPFYTRPKPIPGTERTGLPSVPMAKQPPVAYDPFGARPDERYDEGGYMAEDPNRMPAAIDTLARYTAEGALGTVEGTGKGLRLLSGNSPEGGGVTRAAGSMLEGAARAGRSLLPPESTAAAEMIGQKSFTDDPTLLFNPQYMAKQAGMAAGSMIAFMAPTVAALGRVSTAAGAVRAAAAQSVAESLANSAEVYDQAIAMGKTPEEAADLFRRNLPKDLPFTFLTNKLGPFNEMIPGRMLRGGVGMASEAFQEVGQGAIGRQTLGKPLLEGAGEEALGGVLGGMVGGAISPIADDQQQPQGGVNGTIPGYDVRRAPGIPPPPPRAVPPATPAPSRVEMFDAAAQAVPLDVQPLDAMPEAPSAPPPMDPQELYQRARQIALDSTRLGTTKLAKDLGIDRDQARGLLDQLTQEGVLEQQSLSGGAANWVNIEKRAARKKAGRPTVVKAAQVQDLAAEPVQPPVAEEFSPSVPRETMANIEPPETLPAEFFDEAPPRQEEVIGSEEGLQQGQQGEGREDQGRPVEAVQKQEEEKPREFSSTQVNLPGPVADEVRRAAAAIPDEDLADNGREDEPHITVKYGLHSDKADEVAAALADEPPVRVKLGKVTKFPEKDGRGFEVVKFDVDSPDLHRLNKKVADAVPHTDTFPTYEPHVTLAYVKPGTADKYVGEHPLTGTEIELDRIMFSGKDRTKVEIPLTGKPKAAEAPPAKSQIRKSDPQDTESIGQAEEPTTPPQPEVWSDNPPRMHGERIKKTLTPVYEKALAAAHAQFPDRYRWPASTIPAVAGRMVDALVRGSANIDGPAWKATAKHFGIKNTRKAWNEWMASLKEEPLTKVETESTPVETKQPVRETTPAKVDTKEPETETGPAPVEPLDEQPTTSVENQTGPATGEERTSTISPSAEPGSTDSGMDPAALTKAAGEKLQRLEADIKEFEAAILANDQDSGPYNRVRQQRGKALKEGLENLQKQADELRSAKRAIDMASEEPAPVEPIEAAEESKEVEEDGTAARNSPAGPADIGPLDDQPAVDGSPTQAPRKTRGSRTRSPGKDAGRAGATREEGDGPEPSAGDGAGGSVLPGRGDAPAPGRTARGVDRPNNEGDYRLTEETLSDLGGKITRFRANLDAIETLKNLEKEGRRPTPEEARTLARYVGWGGLSSEAFRMAWGNKTLVELQDRLKKLLTEEELNAASRSTRNAHYTSLEVAEEIWAGLKRIGARAGMRYLEPAIGTGNFYGAQPDSLLPSWRTGVEMDNITAGIAKMLYPNANILHSPYQDANFPDNYFDVVVSNVPFAQGQVADPTFKRRPALTSGIHNYYFAKALEQVKPGGVIAFVTSRYTMDAKDSTIRDYLASKADLIGAIRLPGGRSGAFADNAGTEVTTDIIFLRKRKAGEAVGGYKWVKTESQTANREDGTPGEFQINEYFAANPDMMLGEMTLKGTMYRPDEPALSGTFERQDLTRAMKKLPAGVLDTSAPAGEKPFVDPIALTEETKTIKLGAFGEVDGKLMIREKGGLVPANLSAAMEVKVRGMMGIRDVLNTVYRTQLEDAPAADIEAARKALNKKYDAFTKDHGPISRKDNRRAFGTDPDYFLIKAIESYDDETQTATKRDVFSKRTIEAYQPAVKVDGAADALAIAMAERGFPDWTRMESLTGKTREQLTEELGDAVFENPAGEEWEAADEYLSGEVKKKLKEAEAAAKTEPRRYERNVTALRAVQPTPLSHEEISVRAGASWIPASDIKDYIVERIMGGQGWAEDIRVEYSHAAAVWSVFPSKTAQKVPGNVKFNKHFYATDLMEMALNMKRPKVYDPPLEEGKKPRLNVKETLKAEDAQDRLIKDFETWLWADEKRRKRLVDSYNDEFNGVRLWEPNGAHLNFPGMAKRTLRAGDLDPHQKNAVWRMIRTGNTLLAHIVGAGKTFEMIAAGMEMKRTGLIRKPMYVVPNHLIEQWGDDFLRLYPKANVLIAGKDSFAAGARQETASRIAAGNYDAIILSHKSFEALPVSLETFKAFVEEETKEIRQELNRLRVGKDDKEKKGNTVKRLENQLENLEQQLKKRQNAESKDNTIEFETLGVDQLFVDEAHMYKNLGYVSSMDRVAGLPNTNSNRAFDMFIKSQYLSGRQIGRGVVFATGTPVANSLAEMYTMMRYLSMPYLKQKGIDKFDAWAKMFGRAVRGVEVAPEGGKFRMNTRFVEFVNVPELIKGFRGVADVKTADDLNLPRPKLEGGKPTTVVNPPHPLLKALVRNLGQRAAAIRGGMVDPRDDNMLKITFEGRTAALDLKMQLGQAYEAAEAVKQAIPEAVKKVDQLKESAAKAEEKDRNKALRQVKEAEKELSDLRAIATEVQPYLDDPKKIDKETGKMGMVADNAASIWKRTKAEKSTQLIFLDIGTPKEKSAKQLEQEEKTDTQVEGAEEDITLLGYRQLRSLLVKKGVADEQIAFIHEAKTDDQKKSLFNKVNAGSIRILIGSTEKMGAGTNVQKRLKALHHVDVPWRPADIEQREGRILRQGNENEQVGIFQYVSEGSFDAYMWQGIATKAKMISAAMSGDLLQRTIADTSTQVLSAKEAIALSSGDPIVQERLTMEAKVGTLRRQKANAIDARKDHELSVSSIERQAHLQRVAAGRAREAAEKKAQWVAKNPDAKPLSLKGAKKVDGVTLLEVMREAANGDEIGNLGPFKVVVNRSGDWATANVVDDPVGDFDYALKKLEAEESLAGMMGSLTSYYNTIEARVTAYEKAATDLDARLATFRNQAPPKFDKEAELAEAEKRLDEINDELGLGDDEGVADDSAPAAGGEGATPYSAGFMGSGAIEYYAKQAYQRLRTVVKGRATAARAQKPDFLRKEVREAMDAARTEPELQGKLKTIWESLRHGFTREFEHLEAGAKYAELRVEFHRVSKAKGTSTHRAAQAIIDQLGELDREEFKLFLDVVAFRDLVARVQQQGQEGNPVQDSDLPWKLKNKAELFAAKREAEARAGQNPKIAEALRLRREMWNEVKPDYIAAMLEAGIDIADTISRKDYFRHRVLSHLEAKNAVGGTGSTGAGQRFKTPVGRGWLKKSMVNPAAYSLDYIRAEFEVLQQMMYDTSRAKFISYIADPKSGLNIAPELKKKAAAHNKALVMPYFASMARNFNRQNPGAPKQTAESMFKRVLNTKQAIAMSKLGKHAKAGRITGAPQEFNRVIRQLAAGRAIIPDVLPLANWIMKNGTDAEVQKAAGMLLKGIAAKRQTIKKMAGNQYIGSLEKAYNAFALQTHVLYQPQEGHHFYMGATIEDAIAEEIEKTGAGEVLAKEIRRARIQGQKRRQLVLPREVVETMKQFMQPSQGVQAMSDKILGAPLTAWKKWKLIHPFSFLKYNIRNLTGDLERIATQLPGALKYSRRALREIREYKKTGKMPSPEFRTWWERGGMDANLQVAELGEVNRLRKLNHLLVDPGQSAGAAAVKKLGEAWESTWTATRTMTDIREGILRYAAFLEFQRQVNASPDGRPKTFGASLRGEVMALPSLDDRAYKLSNDLMLAYDEVSRYGQWVRRSLIPFWSFQEQNFRAYTRIIRNAVVDGRTAAAVGTAALGGVRVGAWTAIKVGQTVTLALALKTLVTAFNWWWWPDEEDDVPESVQKDTHGIFGRDAEGKVIGFSRIGLVDDLLEWAGLDAAPFYVRQYLNGYMTLQEMAQEMAKSPANKLLSGLTPLFKLPGDLLYGKSTFPDAWEARTINDRGEYIARELNVLWAYKKLVGKPQKALGAGTLADFVVYRWEPKETHYNAFRFDFVPKWKVEHGKGGGGGFQQNRAAKALYNVRMAIRYEDKGALAKGLEEYTAAGGTQKNLQAAIDRLHPLGALTSKKDRKAFEATLDARRKRQLEQAILFWKEHFDSKRAEVAAAARSKGLPAKKKRK